MNAVSTKTDLVPAINEDEAVRVLQASLYPGARPDSIKLVLAWCRATGRDPMKKPIHIVPMKVKDQQTGRWEWRDVLMPGIGTYRSDAAKTGTYAGKDEPEFGPDKRGDVDGCELTYPEWCKVTIKRIVAGQICSWTAKELWLENYASGAEGKGVNAMWRKRPYGQLAKVAESQALRMAFPDETGNTYTSEEMEGKHFEGTTIDADPPTKATKGSHKTIRSEHYKETGGTEPEAAAAATMTSTFLDRAEISLNAEQNGTKWLKILEAVLAEAPTLDDLTGLRAIESVKFTQANAPSLIKAQIKEAFANAAIRLAPQFNGNGKHAPEAEAEVKTVADALKAEPNDDPEKEFEPGDPLP
jgi:phage recombination protein Bet